MTENRGKGNSAKGKEEQKPVTTVALDRVCVRAWLRHVWRCKCACICLYQPEYRQWCPSLFGVQTLFPTYAGLSSSGRYHGSSSILQDGRTFFLIFQSAKTYLQRPHDARANGMDSESIIVGDRTSKFAPKTQPRMSMLMRTDGKEI